MQLGMWSHEETSCAHNADASIKLGMLAQSPDTCANIMLAGECKADWFLNGELLALDKRKTIAQRSTLPLAQDCIKCWQQCIPGGVPSSIAAC